MGLPIPLPEDRLFFVLVAYCYLAKNFTKVDKKLHLPLIQEIEQFMISQTVFAISFNIFKVKDKQGKFKLEK